MTQELRNLRDDGFEAKWGEFMEETIGERWKELYKQEDDYWEKKSEKYSEFIRINL